MSASLDAQTSGTSLSLQLAFWFFFKPTLIQLFLFLEISVQDLIVRAGCLQD